MPPRKTRKPKQPSITRYALLLLFEAPQQITAALVVALARLIEERIVSPSDQTEIDLWLEGSGGCGHEAYRIGQLLRACCRWWRVVIPGRALSATAQLALGGDEIYLGPSSQLGPLDIQLQYDGREDSVSAIDVEGSLTVLNEKAAEYVATTLAAVPEQLRYSPREVLSFAGQLYAHNLGKVDPLLMARLRRNLTSPARYTTQALEQRRCPAPEGFDAEQVAHEFVFGHSSHDEVIDRIEAARLGLPIGDLYAYPYYPLVQAEFDSWLDSPLPRELRLAIVNLSE